MEDTFLDLKIMIGKRSGGYKSTVQKIKHIYKNV